MKVLFDNGTPKPIAACLTGHEITYARQIGWHEMANGELIQQAEAAGYDVLLSTDKNIRYQQNFVHRKIALVVLGNQQWPIVKKYLDRIAAAISVCTPGRLYGNRNSFRITTDSQRNFSLNRPEP